MRDPTTDPEILLWPFLTRFYGLTPYELLRMPRRLVGVYLEAMPEIRAQEQLLAMQIADFPHMEQKARESLHRKITVMATADEAPAADPRSADAVRDLSAIGIKVVHG